MNYLNNNFPTNGHRRAKCCFLAQTAVLGFFLIAVLYSQLACCDCLRITYPTHAVWITKDSHLLHLRHPVSPFSTQVREQPSSTDSNKVPLFSLQRLANRFFFFLTHLKKQSYLESHKLYACAIGGDRNAVLHYNTVHFSTRKSICPSRR